MRLSHQRILMTEALHDAVKVFALAATQVNEAALGAINDTLTWTAAAQMLDEIRAAVEEVGKIDASLVKHIYLTGPHGSVEVEGIGVLDVRRGTARKAWDERSAVGALIDAHLAHGDGVEPTPWEVADWILEAAGISYFRVTALRARGLIAGDYCTETTGKPTVQITRPG